MSVFGRTRMIAGLAAAWLAVPLGVLGAASCGDEIRKGGGGSGGSGGSGGDTPDGGSGVPLQAGSPWPKFRGNAAQDGRSAVQPSLTGGKLWSFPTGKGIFSSPIVGADGTVYVGSADRIFYALTPEGKVVWSELTGEIIDSAALIDDRGRVYFGSGDGKLRARDAATGAEVWTMSADPPSVNSAFINWFEGNVAIGPGGTLYAPNDNFYFYAVNRDDGDVLWHYKMPDQTWSSPAIDDTAGTLYIGNNNLLPLLGKNTFSINPDGSTNWAASALGTVAASPMLAGGRMIVGGFDGYVRAYDAASGEELWATGTRDHVYGSAALLPDGAVVVPSCDGTIYALEAATGAVRWAFDTREPVRSSPAVDADGNVYVGSGEGRLFVLGKDGALRWSMLLVEAERNDLNASPALGAEAIYIAGESGEIWSVPYEYCLRPEAQADARCVVGGGEALPDGVSLTFTTAFGSLLSPAPSTIDKNQPLTFTLLVREGGDSKLAILDSTSLAVSLTPPGAADLDVAGDGKFVTITPRPTFSPAADGTVKVTITGDYLVDLDRQGLKLSGGEVGGKVDTTFTFSVRADDAYPLPLPAPSAPGDPAGTWEIARLALPLPTILPSYNQIGFDSLHYLVGIVEASAGKGVAWMAGAKLEGGENKTVIDPATKALLPLSLTYDKGTLTLLNQDGLSVEVMSAVIPFRTFRIAAHLDGDGLATEGARLSGSTVCGGVPLYGSFLQQLGLCNPQTDVLSVFGGAYLRPYEGGIAGPPSGLGTVSWSVTADAVTATLTGSQIALADHVAAILLIDPATSAPITLSYGLDTTRTATPDGKLSSVSIPRGGASLPAMARAYLMIDTYPASVTTLTLP